MFETLQPCPFCGSKPEVTFQCESNKYLSIYTRCPSCKIVFETYIQPDGSIDGKWHTEDIDGAIAEATNAWNRRYTIQESVKKECDTYDYKNMIVKMLL